MTPESQRIAIAEACPFVRKAQTDSPLEYDFAWTFQGITLRFDPLNDLNAMHEAEKVLTADQCFHYQDFLRDFYGDWVSQCGKFSWHATAAQRAEAFLRTLGPWTD